MQALVHPPSPNINDCQRTWITRERIDPQRALRQHEAYCQVLRECGVEVIGLRGNEKLPDGAFVEDTAIVLDDLAIIASMGAAPRCAEVAVVRAALDARLPTAQIRRPAYLEGGDVLKVGRYLLVGHSQRTNRHGIQALRSLAEPAGWTIVPVEVVGCLHLKTACTAIDDQTLIVRRPWIDDAPLGEFELIDAPNEEPFAANVLRVGESLCVPALHPRTAELLASMGKQVRTVDISELAKAEAGMTCMSLLL